MVEPAPTLDVRRAERKFATALMEMMKKTNHLRLGRRFAAFACEKELK